MPRHAFTPRRIIAGLTQWTSPHAGSHSGWDRPGTCCKPVMCCGVEWNTISSLSMAASSRAFLRLQRLRSHLRPTPLTIFPSTTIARPAAARWPGARMSSTSIPKTMKGVLVEKTGGVEVLQYRTDLPVPEPKEGQLLIKNETAGINFIDT